MAKARHPKVSGIHWRLLGAAFLSAIVAFWSPVAPTQEPPKRTLEVAAGTLHVETVAAGLSYPWSLIFLPDGDMLVSEKHPGRLRRVSPDGSVGDPIDGLPEIFSEGNGGLLGLALDPDFEANSLIYFAYSEPGENGTSGLSVGRGRLAEGRLEEVETIWRQSPKVEDVRNFGGRLTFAPDGRLFVMTGDRFAHDLVQDPSNTIGVIARIERNGDIPPDNPFVDTEGYDPSIWSWGHRNIGGGAMHPETGQLWIHEFGPWGGDELNIPEAGENHGWPVVSWGRHYSGETIPDPPMRPEFASSIFHWTPVISPSGMIFYGGSEIPAWKGNLLIGGLSSQSLFRLTLRGETVIGEERIEFGARIRDLTEGPDGAVYLLTDQPYGEIFRLRLEKAIGQ
ncbi:PQQ-dependent sugar dehydrogenase [Inquilinus sp. CAU 1745]|uniref:PQQ-dependent sugar dehydrogenase n=1 Tax=Inquilinus sp. CAU 1745 TaxID=3140369 RepID=UPI00325B1C94